MAGGPPAGSSRGGGTLQINTRVNAVELDRIAGYRYGFMIADMVLGDTLSEFADGAIDEDELAVALQQHRLAYEGYIKKVHEFTRPVAEA